jgi:hypothetical protein
MDSFLILSGALMVLTLKVISCAMNYNDGLLKEEELREVQKKNRLIKLPSFIEYVGYCLCCGSHFAGPVYEMKDYLEWTERKGVCLLCLFCASICFVSTETVWSCKREWKRKVYYFFFNFWDKGLVLVSQVELMPCLAVNIWFLVLLVHLYRFGPLVRKHPHHHLSGQQFELFSKLLFAWPCICT